VSHFTVLVVTEGSNEESVISEALQPYHEYECTGVKDQYVRKIDVTDEINAYFAREVFAGYISNEYEYEYSEAAAHEKGLTNIEKTTLKAFIEKKSAITGEDETAGCARDYNGCDLAEDGRFYRETNPDAKWDWWRIGGRWGDLLLHKNGEYCNSLQKKDLDIEVIRKRACSSAISEYGAAKEALDGRTFKSWAEIRDIDLNVLIDAARAAYNTQPGVAALRIALGPFYDVDKCLATEEEFVNDAKNNALSTFAVLYNGEWIESGTMGWWACVSDKKQNWPEIFNGILDKIPDDAYLTVVDCHI